VSRDEVERISTWTDGLEESIQCSPTNARVSDVPIVGSVVPRPRTWPNEFTGDDLPLKPTTKGAKCCVDETESRMRKLMWSRLVGVGTTLMVATCGQTRNRSNYWAANSYVAEVIVPRQ
jgi:hypothetical protein